MCLVYIYVYNIYGRELRAWQIRSACLNHRFEMSAPTFSRSRLFSSVISLQCRYQVSVANMVLEKAMPIASHVTIHYGHIPPHIPSLERTPSQRVVWPTRRACHG